MNMDMNGALLEAVVASRGHFVYESGHHGDLWLELDELFVEAQRVWGWAAVLAQKAVVCQPDLICGPLTGGAFLAQAMAAEIGADFVFAERIVSDRGEVAYRIPRALQRQLPGQRVLLVDDVINAASALLATWQVLLACGAEVAGLAALLSLGETAAQLAGQQGVPLFRLAWLERGLWQAGACPLCQAGVPLDN